MKEIDVRGLSCPLPVMRCEEAILDEEKEILVRADSGTAKANVVNLLEDAGYDVSVEDTGDGWAISAMHA